MAPTVEDDADTLVFVVQRLLAGRQVDDRQAAMSEANARLDVHAALHRTAVVLRLVHPRQHGAIDVTPPAGVENSCYAAHDIYPGYLSNTWLKHDRQMSDIASLIQLRKRAVIHDRSVASDRTNRDTDSPLNQG